MDLRYLARQLLYRGEYTVPDPDKKYHVLPADVQRKVGEELLTRDGPQFTLHDSVTVLTATNNIRDSSKFTGWSDIPLTDIGRKEAHNISYRLKHLKLIPENIYSSVLDRCIETTNIIKNNTNTNSNIYTSWRLNEKHYGTLEGIPRSYIRDEYGSKFTEMMRNNFYMKPPVLG